MTGWRYVYPSDGKFAVNVTDTNVSGLVFANQLMPAEAETEIIVPIEAEDVTVPGNDTVLVEATVA
jgi:hypothetical protein